ncbi:MOSC domain-containing protein [Nocardioides campestrisoli]|uniref:MOSC domain-containing protein n=1 Tax=Nocardioides campestrisoli TaxID=2736757 RepID=UPI0015E659F6|nr:MOSC domain-containing protein [Nocardioides campestrisoli]
MEVTRLGLTPLKGARHETRQSVSLAGTGAVGDRIFCLVDPATQRCLRTVENPRLLQARVTWDGTSLGVVLPTGSAQDRPRSSGQVLEVDYWGRPVRVEVQDGPWATLFSAHLGREVALVSAPPGQVVYGGAVTLVTRPSLRRLGERVGVPVSGARFRATLELDGPDLPAGAEDTWTGRRLRVGQAEVTVTGPIYRCAVIDLDPETAVRDLTLLKTLAGERPPGAGLAFGVEAEVSVPGQVRTGDAVVLDG